MAIMPELSTVDIFPFSVKATVCPGAGTAAKSSSLVTAAAATGSPLAAVPST